MYIDLIIIIVLLILVIICFRRFSSFVYSFAIIDIFLKIVNFIKNHIPFGEIKSVLSRYFPGSLEHVIHNYSSGIIETVLMWAYIILYIIFLGYVIKIFIHKKK